MFFVHHLSKLNLSLNVVWIMTALQKWLAFKNVVRTHVCLPIHASVESNVMFYPHHLAARLLHAPVPMDKYPTAKDTANQVFTQICMHFLNANVIIFSVVAQSECRVNQDCQDSHLCHQGSCQNACRFTTCGQNAFCASSRHEGHCKCYDGFFGNPLRACQKREYFNIFFLACLFIPND